jgi:superfamily II RNA helicase
VKDNKLQIILPPTAPTVEEKEQPKKHLTKEDLIKAGNARRILERRVAEETRKLANIEVLLKRISSDDYSTAIDSIDQNLPNFETSEIRLQLFQRKFDLQRNYLRALRKKPTLTMEEKSKLEFLQVACLATMSAMVELENIRREIDIFKKKKILIEELIDHSPFDLERWYRFQMEKVNNRLPRREQGQPDDRISRFSNEKWNPDQWQVEFLNAIDQQQSVIIVAPTASGKTYASYYAMYQVRNGKFGPNGICVYVAPTKALVNQVAGMFDISFLE